ncbi:MAG TPA: molybdenum ABC transporter ATP-binding protein [Thermoanaerobaculia bacterium]|nr:molybdenum ABC transporter ATP-binding protein [Thermoanaerobaculia bacterium]
MIEIDLRLPLVHFELEVRCKLEASVTAVVGPSGSGKTSLLEALAGLRGRAKGRIAIDGALLLDSDGRIALPPEARGIGYVPQDAALFPHLTARENIRFARNDADRFDALVATLELAPLLDRRPATLSGGERQRVALARALMTEPRLLLLDEPLASIDQPLRDKILVYLRRIRDIQRAPMLYVTHQPFEALALASDCLVLRDGRIVAQGSPDSVMHDPAITGSAAIENVFHAIDPRHDATRGITRVSTAEGIELVLPHDQLAAATFPLVVRISGDDIVVLGERPAAISSRNVLEGSVIALHVGEGIADVTFATPARIHVRLTRDAAEDLRLGIGSRVWLALRSRAFRIVG